MNDQFTFRVVGRVDYTSIYGFLLSIFLKIISSYMNAEF